MNHVELHEHFQTDMSLGFEIKFHLREIYKMPLNEAGLLLACAQKLIEKKDTECRIINKLETKKNQE